MSSRTSFQRVLACAALLGCGAVSACALLLDGAPALGTTCEFQGDSSDCGRCLQEACEDEIAACCSGGCGDVLDDLDACAGEGDIDACARLKDADDEEREELARCAGNACSSACSSAPPITRCRGDGEACTCVIDRDDPNDETCSVELGGCCADATWPASGECTCAELYCYDSGSSCACARDRPGGDEETCDDGPYDYCCITPEGCECQDDRPCVELGYEPTSSCRVRASVCFGDRIEVDRCDVDKSED